MTRKRYFPRWHKRWWLGICARCGRQWIKHGSPEMWRERLGPDHPNRKLAQPPDVGRTINLHAESKGLIATPEEALIARPDRQYGEIIPSGGGGRDLDWTMFVGPHLRARGRDDDDGCGADWYSR
jgi:hypothetical protein